MNVLFVYYVPSGGMDTLNRQRCKALRQYGIEAHCLYYGWGAGLQNPADGPLYVTKNDIAIKHLLDSHHYQAIIVTTDHRSFERFRLLGYSGKLVLEIQGYGPKAVAREQLTLASPWVTAHASGLLHPNTPHIAALFEELYPAIPRFAFNNCFDSAAFAYREHPKPDDPIIAWMGRIEDNKNWREFLLIGHRLAERYPKLTLWMFEDPNLADKEESRRFVQMVGELGLGERLVRRSNVPHAEMQNYLSLVGDSGGFLCSTSKVEGAPYAVLEAMSCRCPVLTTDSDGVSTSIFHNVTGKFYTLGDVAHAVSEAVELMDNETLRANIRAAARQHVQANFDPLLYGRHFVNMLQSI